MLSLKYENDCILVSGYGNTLNFDNNFISFGLGDAAYRMSHGSFKFNEDTLDTFPCKIRCVEQIDNSITVSLECRGRPVGKIVFLVEDDFLRIKPMYKNTANRISLTYSSDREEGFYGCGEIFSEFNLKGQKVNVWVAEHINALQTAKKLARVAFKLYNPEKKQKFSAYETYYAQPTYLSSHKYFVHCVTTDFASFDFTENNLTTLTVNDSECEFVFGFGSSFDDALKKLTSVLGRQPELPEWTLNGSILGIQGGTEIMLKKVSKCLEEGTKVSGVWIQDWEGRRVTAVGRQLMWNWQYDETLYPGLPDTIRELKEKNIRVLGYINPFLAVEKNLYKYASSKGYCVKDKDGNDYLVKITTFPAAMVDFTNPDAYDWIKSIIKDNMIGIGLSGWMADFGEYLPTDCVLASGESAEKVHNTWPAIWAKINLEAIEETETIGDVFFFTRSGYTETVKYSTMMWNGDQHVDYSVDYGIGSVIPASLGLCCCGFGLVHSDIGGYTTILNLKRTPELFMRWCEMNCFTVLMRSHEGLNPDANAQFDYDDKVLRHHGRMSRIHAALKPYICDIIKENAKNGTGTMRPLFFDYSDKFKDEATEYMFGRDMLVAPVIKENSDKRTVKLPDDNWIELWTGKEYYGGTYEISADLGYPPVFYKSGSKYINTFEEIKNIK